jgi:hypothetical protein
MLRPKIVSPHLVISPRFSMDVEGRHVVSRCPVLVPKLREDEQRLIAYMTAVLNSSAAFWQIAVGSHRYSRGYLMLEPKTLERVRIPDPTRVPPGVMKEILERVSKLSKHSQGLQSDKDLDRIIAGLYGLSADERRLIGLGEADAQDNDAS